MYANGFKYWLAYRKGTSGYYRCSRYKFNCPGRCTVNDDGTVHNSTPHDHPPESDRVAVERFRKVLSRRAASETTDLHKIYLEEATGHHVNASLLYTFSQAESCMRKARRKLPPTEPSSIEEVGDILQNSELFRINCGSDSDAFYQTTVKCEGGATGLVLWHKRTLDVIGEVDTLFVDSSFEICTNGSSKYHVLIGSTFFKNRCIPVIYSIMMEKNSAVYARIFASAREQLGKQFVPKLILNEPDEVICRALETYFPEATVKVYWHYYMAAVLRQMHELNIRLETTERYANSALKMLLVLPQLPANYMSNGLYALKLWMREKTILSPNYSSLLEFVENIWLTVVGTERLSMFGLAQSKFTLAKTFLQALEHKNTLSNHSIWRTLEVMAQLATKQYVILNKHAKKIGNKNIQPKMKSKARLIREETIQIATKLWLEMPEHQKDSLKFLQACSHCLDNSIITETSLIENRNKPMSEYPVHCMDQTSKVKQVIVSCQTQHAVNVAASGSEPPPLVFFKKSKQAELNNSTGVCWKATDPPPLVPFIIASSICPRMQRTDSHEDYNRILTDIQ